MHDYHPMDSGGRRRITDRRVRVTASQDPEQRTGWKRRSGWDRRYRQLQLLKGLQRRTGMPV